MPVTATVAVGLAAGLDAAFGEPPARIHPVALLGRVVARIERAVAEFGTESVVRPRLAGAVVAAAVPLGFAGVATALVGGGAAVDPWLGSALAGGVLFSTTSLRLLLDSGRTVIRESDTDVAAARVSLRALAGRDATSLDAAHVRSAAVESLAENLADGLVAPLLAFAVVAGGAASLAGAPSFGTAAAGAPAALTLALAAGAAAWVKAVNTLDSMLGYRSKPVGWAPARLDDAVMWVPARLSALLLAAAAGEPTLPLRRRVRELARRPSSPNSGWPMATMAALLPARLHKPGTYDLDAGAPLPDVRAARAAVRVTRRAGLLAVALAGVIAWF
ncbi:cobalamin biosynthesis protein CobD [Halobellus sp. Atlit-31R]|nr:cobalamin biosynthesis protein CobD [Halobellus sp. Atlit-31R]